ncbi:MAG: endonuclease/exonuclease/phosphatase family protein [Pirellulaceae bacterium]|nr:endonuclease/exonuclease/phosphatase family protein [Planctomycetales bacterium]
MSRRLCFNARRFSTGLPGLLLVIACSCRAHTVTGQTLNQAGTNSAVPATAVADRPADETRAGANGPAIAPDEAIPHVDWKDAKQVVGKSAMVSGTIVAVGHAQRVHFLNFSQDRNVFKLVVFSDALENFPDSLENLYRQKTVLVRGVVTLYQGVPQIQLASPDNIKIVDVLPPYVTPRKQRSVPIGDEITVGTFNVRNLFDDFDDPYAQDETTRAKPRPELERLAQTIRSINADVLAMQEVESRGFLERFLDVFLPDMGYRHVVHFEGNDLRGIDVCVLSRAPVGKVTSYRHLEFPDASGHSRSFNRDLLDVEILPDQGTPFQLWVVHLKSNSDGREFAEPIRLAEAQQLRTLYERALAANPQIQIVLCGDFNDTIDSKTLKTIVGNDKLPLQSFLNELPDDQTITYNQPPYLSMIDFVFCSPSMATRYVPQSYRIRQNVLEQSGSDHNPVTARFKR